MSNFALRNSRREWRPEKVLKRGGAIIKRGGWERFEKGGISKRGALVKGGIGGGIGKRGRALVKGKGIGKGGRH